MSTATQTDDRFAAIVRQMQTEPAPEVVPPTAPVAAALRVLSFDQSIANTGWCFVTVEEGHPFVAITGHYKTEPERGMAAMLDRAGLVYNEIERILGFVTAEFERPDYITHELPVGGSAMMKPESSLLAALAVRITAQQNELPVQAVASGALKRHLTGQTSASKKQVKEAVLARMPDLKERKIKPLNEHVYDSIAVALTFLES